MCNIKYSYTANLIAFLTMALFNHAYAADAARIYDQENVAITVTSAQSEFVIKLKANPSTGYTWVLSNYDKALVTPLTHRYEAAQTKLIGAPGFDLWTFRAKPAAFTAGQKSKINFDYVRPWEEKVSAGKAEFIVGVE